ncbi:MAG: Lrp/AsnC family transcriptional regulator [Ruminococcus sp.]|jgi:Lrp/AsnC family leucine-responsive transcriptional regulator|nr:Lrp/AsnC family transcriptional regulator [Ruminococcus sp.]
MDRIDETLIRELQKNARTSLKDISKQINLSLPSTSERLRKLEQAGYISGYTALLDNLKLGKALTCFCTVVLKEQSYDTQKKFRQLIQQIPEITECHYVTGEYEYIMKIITDSTKSLDALLQSFREDYNVIKTYTYTVLSTIKSYPGIQL